MMAYQFIPCKTDADWEAYTLYILDHKLEIHSAFLAKRVIHFIKEQVLYGSAVIVKDASGQVIAALGFVYGTPEKGFTDKETVRLEMVHILPTYRNTRLFLRGLIWLKEFLKEHVPATQQIQFYTESSPAERKQLFEKIADLISTEPTRFGVEHEFVASLDRLNRWKLG
jgi:hypothetical protein